MPANAKSCQKPIVDEDLRQKVVYPCVAILVNRIIKWLPIAMYNKII
jgi:hypothetical protein